jgi:YD repeat-containing protein
MSRFLRLLVVCAVCCVSGLVGYAAIASPSLGAKTPAGGAEVARLPDRTKRAKPRGSSFHGRAWYRSNSRTSSSAHPLSRHGAPGHRRKYHRLPSRLRHAPRRRAKLRERGYVATASSLSPLGSLLVVSGSPTEGEQIEAARTTISTNPERINRQVVSETAYEGLSAEGAGKVDVEAFPASINEPAGGPPRLPEGEEVAGFASPYAAQVDLSSQAGTEHAVVESTAPMALEGSSGGWEPVNLGLQEVGGALEPSNPLVAVRINKHLSEGIQLPAIGVSVTPIDSGGSSLGGSEGAVDGASAFFANSMTDSDTVIKPSAFGFSIDTALRSAKSPEEVSFRIGLPAGASLVKASEGSDGLMVVKEGVIIAGIPAPLARDAAGQVLPVSISLAGDVITLTVARPTGKYLYPIDIDPEFNTGSDKTVNEQNWKFTNNGWFNDSLAGENEMSINYYGSYDEYEYGALNYQTHRHSKIYELNANTSFSPSACCNNEGKLYSQNPWVSDTFEIHGPGGNESGVAVVSEPTSEWPVKTRLCAKPECAAANGSEDNTATLQSTITGGSNPAKGEYSGVGDELKGAAVAISQPAEIHSTVGFNTTAPEIAKTINILYGKGAWLNAHQGAFEYTGSDTGIGIDGINFERNLYGTFENFYSKSLLGTGACAGVQCAEEQKETLVYESSLVNLEEGSHNLSYYLKEGENHVRVSPHDAIAKTGAGEHGEGEVLLKVDAAAPHGFSLSGLPTKGATYQLGENVGHLAIQATDGEGTVASSGVKSISLYVDGKEIGSPHGSCPAGPCTTSGEWTLNGAELGTGIHTLTVSATDNAGNTATKEFALEVYHASPLAIGPGSVNPESGDLALEASDVQLSGGMGDLAVTRHYDSRNVKEGSEGPLGPQWTISLGSLASLEILPDGSAMVVGPEGLAHFTKNSEEKFVAPTGDSELTLESKSGEPYKEYILKNSANGTTTRFTRPTGANAWMPTVSEGPVATDTVTDTYKAVEVEGKTIVEPVLELAPHPATTCEAKKLARGCRALEFDYASSTTAKGEAENEWDEYKGHLTRVYAIAWNPAKGEKGEMASVPVAEYTYDKQGRLRAEWDPRIESSTDCGKTCSSLKTMYGYDSEGHITAITSPGQQTLAFLYGTVPADTSTGRLLKMTRAPVSVPLWSGEPIKNTEAPSINGFPEVGVRLAASSGRWSGNPVVYGYQWEDCNSSGGECAPIPGATNANYTPTLSDANRVVTVLVTATNGGGSATVSRSITVGTNQTTVDAPFGITSGPDGNLWFTNPSTSKLGKITPSGATTEYTLPWGSFPTGIASGPDGNVWFIDNISDKVGKITTSGVITEYALPAGSKPSGIVAGPDGNLWFSELGSGAVGKITTSGVITEYALPAGSKPSGITEGADGNLWVIDRGREKVEKVTTADVITEYALPSGSQPEGITAGPDGNVWFTDFHSNKIGKITTSGVVSEYVLPNESWPTGISTGPDGNLWFTDYNSNKIGKITTSGVITEYALPSTSFPVGITSGPDGNLWFANYSSGKIGKITTSGTKTEYGLPAGGHQFGITSGPDGNLWFTNPSTSKLGKITPSGATTEYTLPWGSFPTGIASGPDGNVWFIDNISDKVGKITTSGVITEYALPAGSKPSGIVAGPDGNLWFSELGSGAVGKITTSGVITEYALPAGSKPSGITEGADGNLWVIDRGREKVEKVTTADVITEYALPSGSQPEGITAGPDGNVWFTDFHSNKIGKITTSGVVSEYVLPNESWPTGISTGPDGNLWFTDYNSNKIGKITTSGVITEYALPSTSFPVGITSGPDGNLWFANYSSGKIGKITTSGATTEYALPDIEGEIRNPEPGTTIEYNVPVSGAGAPYELSTKEVETWNQNDAPIEATAIFPADEPQTWPATKYKRATIDYMDSQARTVNTATPGGGISTTQYNQYNDVDSILSAENRQIALAEGGNTVLNAARLGTKSAYEDEGTRLTWTEGPEHEVKIAKGNEKVPSGSEILAYNRVLYYYDEGAPTGETYNLVTKTVDEAESATGEHFDVRTSTTSYSGQSNLGWKLREPTSTVTDPEGLKLTHTTLYNETTGSVVETRGPASAGAGEVHDSIAVYYTSEPNATYPACGDHVEWAGLPCETLPGKQPKTSGLPPLPEKTITYNIWNEPEVVTEKFGSTTRTRKTTFDEAGRAITSEVTSTTDTPVPAITDQYNETTGALTKETEIVEGKEKILTSTYNSEGQLTSYTDADGATTNYEYEGEGSYNGEKEKDGRLRHVNDGKGSQTYSYDETTGLMAKLVDSAAGTFTASYNLAGHMTSETYPNNMTAAYTYNSVGDATDLEYKKNADCAKTCPEIWFSDTIDPSIHGEMLKQTSTLAEEPKYTYDAAGRLTEVQEIPTGKGCVTRLYAYNNESDRTSLTSREPTSEGKCASEGGTIESHTYDEASRLIDIGVAYDTFGNTTKTPAADAGSAEISSSFYVDNQVASQTQDGETSTYYMDPAGRLRETVSSGKTASITIDHYPGSGSAISWVGEPEEKWTRNIPGIDGTLSATQTNNGTVTLLLHDLQGNVVGTASSSETETKMLTPYSSTEFGVPQSGSALPKYAWLGAVGVISESPTGTVVQDGVTYIPQTGRSLQTQSLTVPIPQNAAAQYMDTLEPWVAEGDAAAAAQQVLNAELARKAAEEADQPTGLIPMPEFEEGGGEEESGGGCSGMNACAASVPHGVEDYKEKGNSYMGCEVWGSWGAGEFLAGEISGWGHWKCDGIVPGFEMQIEAYGEGAPEFEGYEVRLGSAGQGNKITYTWEGKSSDGNKFQHTWKCPATGSWYHLWFWGRQLGIHGLTQWSASGWEGEVGTCTKQGPVDMSPIGEGAEES